VGSRGCKLLRPKAETSGAGRNLLAVVCASTARYFEACGLAASGCSDLGYKNESVTTHYSRARIDELQDAVEKVLSVDESVSVIRVMGSDCRVRSGFMKQARRAGWRHFPRCENGSGHEMFRHSLS